MTPAASRFSSPESYTPKHLAEKILTSQGALEGERKRVTVLFCDIAGSTSLAERLGAEAMHELLNDFFELVLAKVHRYEGTINQFLGDGFMALFGAPVAHEDHACRAAAAALAIQRAVRQRATELASLSVRIGLNTGPVVVGKIGDNLWMDYTAVGDTTNLAARLQQSATPGTILISETTKRHAGNDVHLEPLAPLSVRGKAEAVPAYRIVDIVRRRSPLERRWERALTRFVGRERELSVLLDLFEQVERGHGQVAGIVGEPGVGKSRLLYEFRQGLAGRRVTCLEARCPSYGASIPYLPILDIIRSNCGITDADRPEEIADKVCSGLQEVGMEPDEAALYLLNVLDVKHDTTRLEVLPPELVKARTLASLGELAVKGSQRRPILFAVEDVHWIDRPSEEYFASLVENLAGAAILFVCTYRPGYHPPWLDRSYATQLALRLLSPSDSLRVVHQVLTAGEHTQRLSEVILAKAEGNLFRYRDVAHQSNARYLNALAPVDDLTPGLRGLDAITTRKRPATGRTVTAFNPVARPGHQLFLALMSGKHAGRGFANRDLRTKLAGSALRLSADPKRKSAQVSRILHRLHVYGLVAKIPRWRRWRVTGFAHHVMGASVRLRNLHFPSLYAEAA